ncbi:hypothetical protein MUO14_05085 [Halobacillus shinanisalinarum]|uniref:Uncharacterized protein n=1 Tax=Halobacillus shinanisalinarum TaxID=2932258 RepID=A0ABY4H2H4_9BACI|nr:hypothetical protein [Halobacillus shinanisalinarum]UOQ94335.1 hypothetical protein MUO14_05085 [Halobacillus shinanisalinarum]
MTTIIRFKIISTEQIPEDRRIHVFDIQQQERLSFNLKSLYRSLERNECGIELKEFLETKKFKIDHGYYDFKSHVS